MPCVFDKAGVIVFESDAVSMHSNSRDRSLSGRRLLARELKDIVTETKL
jgi:hypothetical protein